MATEDAGVEHSLTGDNAGLTPPANTPSIPMADAVAIASAGQATSDPQLTAGILAYLSDQRGLCGQQQEYLRLQMENLHEQRKLTVSHMKWQHLNDVLRGTLQVLLVIVGLGVVIALGAMVWNARHDTGLVVEAFAVPPELEARGYTGSVVAQKVLDRIAVLQKLAIGISRRAAQSYEINWGNDFQVEIPQTGISLGELNRHLRQWLGHETRITGEVVRTDTGLSILARASSDPVESASGSTSELDALIERMAERVFAATQPYRYASSMAALGRIDEAIAAYEQLANSDASATERAWAFGGLGRLLQDRGRITEAVAAARAAVKTDPGVYDGWQRIWNMDSILGHDELALQEATRMYEAAEVKRSDADESARQSYRDLGIANALAAQGDMQGAAEAYGRRLPIMTPSEGELLIWGNARLLALGHDIAGAREVIAGAVEKGPMRVGVATMAFRRAEGSGWLALYEENYVAAEHAFARGIAEVPALAQALVAWLAYTRALQGDIVGATELIRESPADCYPCLRLRGKIAALAKDWPEAERWFAEAARQGPSLPWANTDWAEMLIAKGDAQGATAQAREAIKRGPRFADAYQALGEALALSGDYADAVKQFQQAAAYAPKWGRTQIQWGIALGKLGRSAEAQGKFKVAKTFELAPSEQLLLRIATSE